MARRGRTLISTFGIDDNTIIHARYLILPIAREGKTILKKTAGKQLVASSFFICSAWNGNV